MPESGTKTANCCVRESRLEFFFSIQEQAGCSRLTPIEMCRKLDLSQKRKLVSDYVSDHDAAEYELLRVLRQELRAHYELPEVLPHQILTLMMALNGQGESDERREA